MDRPNIVRHLFPKALRPHTLRRRDHTNPDTLVITAAKASKVGAIKASIFDSFREALVFHICSHLSRKCTLHAYITPILPRELPRSGEHIAR